ncbi:23S rRNA (guanosine(2251)-2'-O)-methyltransferase RlmB [Rhizomicrobium electricum]|uniref:23S rRNA (guanosine(2251)-2'-O)-methyltransferase RlmB n=1 Tax=Rhizomicrobium electricum TaxID=480070 RepID=UPI00141DC815|nr:23S rRNA (guanosine(2251)-2'-O)-methyltransferase RlmB [Rhizomicrobium electricum]
MPKNDRRGFRPRSDKSETPRFQGPKSGPHPQGSKPQGQRSQGPKPQGPRPHRPEKAESGLWLYGLHAVKAALGNPRRKVKRCLVTSRAAEEVGTKLLGRVRHDITDADTVGRALPPGAVHQGVALLCEPLGRRDLADMLTPSERRRIVLVLDQISDPHNAGAILRTAAAFGVSAVVVQDRNSPPESGALAKAASGALDIVPVVSVVNISRALDELQKLGFWRIALAGDGESALKDAATDNGDIALVLGSEGSGIRRLVREHCDAAAFVPMDSVMESLNVSNAAAIALYELRRS